MLKDVAQKRVPAAMSPGTAALAAASKGKDEPPPGEAAKAKLRGQALEWLSADLTLWSRQLETGNPASRAAVQQQLLHWQKDADLAGIRDKDAIANFLADEQQAFTQLWADVETLLKKAEEKPK